MKNSLKKQGAAERNQQISNTIGILIVIIILSVFVWTKSSNFFSRDNIITLARMCSVTILVGYAQMVVIAGGGLNVSIGAIGGMSAVIVGALIKRAGVPWGYAIIIAILIGAVCGAFNGILITRLGATGEISWLVTLATMSIFTGISLTITKANPFYNLPKGYVWIGAHNVFGWIPVMIIIAVVVSVLLWYLFKYASFGRQILAVGSNQRAAELSGVDVGRVMIFKHIFSAVIAAVAGILFSTRLGSIGSDIGGDWMLFSFAAPLIGGTRMAGGRVNVAGAFLGGLLLTIVSNGVVHLQVNVYIVELLEGIIILLAVGLDRIREMREERRERLERAAI
ncbi:MAG TPA: ABC transporter permease [Clostridiaceae bacterium]|nr:ABC transporter permease [Clostridiaceae bacterium]